MKVLPFFPQGVGIKTCLLVFPPQARIHQSFYLTQGKGSKAALLFQDLLYMYWRNVFPEQKFRDALEIPQDWIVWTCKKQSDSGSGEGRGGLSKLWTELKWRYFRVNSVLAEVYCVDVSALYSEGAGQPGVWCEWWMSRNAFKINLHTNSMTAFHYCRGISHVWTNGEPWWSHAVWG